MILGEALVVSISGGLLGIGLGAALVKLASLSASVGGFLTGTLAPTLFAQALATAIVLGVVGGVYPAWRAAHLAPIEAMRAESGVSVHGGRLTLRVGKLSLGLGHSGIFAIRGESRKELPSPHAGSLGHQHLRDNPVCGHA